MCLAMGLVLVGYASWQALRWGPSAHTRLTANLFFYVVSGSAVCSAYLASRRCRRNRRLARAWRFFALGIGGQLAGQVAFSVYDMLGKTPYPSVADVLYLSFYPLMLAGLLSLPMASDGRSGRLRLGVDLAVVAIAGSALVVYVVLGPTLVAHSGSPVQVAFSVAYPAGDMVLLVGISAALVRGAVWSLRWPLRLLAAGLVLFVVGDLVYGYITLHSSYQTGDLVDTTWMVALALMAVAGATQTTATRNEPHESRRSRVSWLPSVAVGLGFGLLLFADRRDAIFPGLTLDGVAMFLAGLVLARQALVQRDLIHAQKQLRHQAFYDALTGLANRTLVLDRAEQMLASARRRGSSLSALFVDLDGFKDVNDSLGHAAGDQLLQAVAVRLTAVVRETDTIGRFGGDEFVVLLDPDTQVNAQDVAERILATLREPFQLEDESLGLIEISASVGISEVEDATADMLLGEADRALYAAKDAGKGRYAVFGAKPSAGDSRHPASAAAARQPQSNRARLAAELAQALDGDAVEVWFQPQADSRTGRVQAVEALVRWRHPVHGLLFPADFVPLAESTGLIQKLTARVLDAALEQCAVWRRAGLDLRVSVNVSASDLLDDLHDRVAAALDRHDLEPSAVVIEVTESAVLSDPTRAGAMLTRLARLGVGLSLDDFGTGFSSLQHLKTLPVTEIKIDRDFVTEMTPADTAIVEAITQLAHRLGKRVVAEGVEDEITWRRLAAAGCELIQGYVLSRPLPADELEATLRNGAPTETLRPATAA
jgi:diguanylate cyclase (GGDEF)-like protein